jgi:hypothetical protein
MYNVVSETIVECASKGAVTWSSFESKEKFDEWNDKKMKSWYKVLAEGVTQEQAIEICSSPKAKLANLLANMRAKLEIVHEVLNNL